MPQRSNVYVALLMLSTCGFVCAQDPPRIPALRAGEQAQALFVASVPAAGAKDDSGKPAAASLDPVVFLVNGELRGCAADPPKADEDLVPKVVLQTLKAYYKADRHYDLWSGGSPWGTAEALKSCIDEDGGDVYDFAGCFQAHPAKANGAQAPFKGLSWTGPAPTATHANERRPATSAERTLFLDQAARIYAEHHVPVKPNSIHASRVVHTRLRADAEALVANTVVQLAAATPHTLYTYRMLVVLEGSGEDWHPVLVHFHRVTVPVESDAYMPKPGTILDEEGDLDRESFVDSIPLYPGEPDAIVTEHTYYESWAYSLYRRVGNEYKLVSTACGGGV